MKKVLLIMPNSGFSGAEKVILQIVNGLKDKYKFVYVSESGKIDYYLSKFNIKHIILSTRLNRNEIISTIKKENPDIIHTVDFRALVTISTINTKIPVVSHLHNNPLWLQTINKRSLLYLFSSFKAKKIMAVSDAVINEFIFKKFLKKKIENVLNPLDTKEILDKVKSSDYFKKYDLCFVGRLTEQKNPILFLEIVNKLKNKNKNIKALMIGTYSEDNKIDDYIKKNDLGNNIKKIDFIENPYRLMASSKVLCMTSKWEGFGLVAFEGLTLGLPVVTTNVGGICNMVDLSCGFFCSSVNEFVQKIEYLIYNKENLDLYSKNALNKSKKLNNIDVYLNNIDKIYEGVMK